jgi:glyoxylase-like metal-dependent hydrolase (beta-lactamase superfamily II)
VAQVEGDGLAFAGDVLYRGRLLSLLSESDLRGWLAAYERLRTLDAALFVPGHGEPGALADFDQPTRDYLAALKDHMDAAVEDGVDLQDAIAGFDQAAWSGLADFDALAGRNAHQAYLQSEQAAFE